MTHSSRYTRMELMICAAARELENDKSAVIGTGMPLTAAMLAQKTTAPNLIIMLESGSLAPILDQLPVSVGDSNSQVGALIHSSMGLIMEACQRGMVDYTLLNCAQIDPYGNINSSLIGTDYRHPQVRLPGSGGASDLAALCWKTLVITPHLKRRFVSRVDFITTPGYLDGPGARERAGLPPGTGPAKVISSLAVMGFDPDTKRMRVESLHPQVTQDELVQNTGFELLFCEPLATTLEPTEEELRILREEIDPHRRILGRGD